MAWQRRQACRSAAASASCSSPASPAGSALAPNAKRQSQSTSDQPRRTNRVFVDPGRPVVGGGHGSSGWRWAPGRAVRLRKAFMALPDCRDRFRSYPCSPPGSSIRAEHRPISEQGCGRIRGARRTGISSSRCRAREKIVLPSTRRCAMIASNVSSSDQHPFNTPLQR